MYLPPAVQKFHSGREFLVRLDVVYAARRRGNAESHQRPRASGRLLGFRCPDVGHVHCQFGGVSDGGKNASERTKTRVTLVILPVLHIARVHTRTTVS